MASVEVAATKDERGENFPVASRLIAPAHRATVLAFYRFARAADDIADDPALSADEKVRRLDLFEATLLGTSNEVAAAMPLRDAVRHTGVSARHAQDLLIAFRMDANKLRYADFAELLHYCRYSAAPVGRFVLDVHGEPEHLWPANDALCAALQIINHLQDCGKDYRLLDRVYLPSDLLQKHGATVAMLAESRAPPPLLGCVHELAALNDGLVREGQSLSPGVRDFRLRLETAIIGRLAGKLNGWLEHRDPLADTVHLSKPGALWQALCGAVDTLARKPDRRGAARPRGAAHS